MTTAKTHYRRALDFVLAHEGGYVNDPDDPGGETNLGISKRAHPDEDIPNLTRERAALIYRRHYWRAAGCHGLPWPLNLALFDAAVQHGPVRGVQLLQLVLGVKVDGINGPRTRAAALRANGPGFLAELLAERAHFYATLVTADSRRAKYLRGWLRRLFDLAREAAL